MSQDKSDEAVAGAELKSRRESLKDIGKFAAVTAPAMMVLVDAIPAAACSTNSNSNTASGNKIGWDKNGKKSRV